VSSSSSSEDDADRERIRQEWQDLWDADFMEHEDDPAPEEEDGGRFMSSVQWASYHLMTRGNEIGDNHIFRCGRLKAEFVISNFVTSDNAKLNYVKKNQDEIRIEQLNGMSIYAHTYTLGSAYILATT
jgi:hypothetical protein